MDVQRAADLLRSHHPSAVAAIQRLAASSDLTIRDDVNAALQLVLELVLTNDELKQIRWTMRDFVHKVDGAGPDSKHWWFRYNDREMLKRMCIALDLDTPYHADGDYRSRYTHTEKPHD